jgi:chromosome segregation ATPase
MDSTERARLEAEVTEADAEIARLRAENQKLAEEFRAAPTEPLRELLRRAASSLSAARDRADAARAALTVFEKTGSVHGLVADKGKITGTIAVALEPGIDRD